MKIRTPRLLRSIAKLPIAVLFGLVFGGIGMTLLLVSHATTPTAPFETESGVIAGGSTTIVNDGSASASQAVRFGSIQPQGVAGNWTLTFDDEFNGTSLNLNNWSNCWFSPGCGPQNNVATSPANVTVSGGDLILTLASANSGASVTSSPLAGAKVGYALNYGVVEARILFPGSGTSSGCYNWPAWWTSGKDWPADGENDIAEVLGGHMTTNYHSPSGAHNQGATAGVWCGAYHVYTLDREQGRSTVYFDGKLAKTYTTDDSGKPEYMIINVGQSGNPVTGTASQVKVDYVRAYQRSP